MMPPAHRHDDSRICGATTTVQNQDSVTVNGKLWSIRDSTNTHGNGQLLASPDSSVTIHGIPVVVHRPENSQPDNLCPPIGEPHCNPRTAEGSDNVSAYG